MKLMIYDPLNHSNNLGNNAKAYELQSMFKAAFISLHANIKEEKLEFMFGLKKICIFWDIIYEGMIEMIWCDFN